MTGSALGASAAERANELAGPSRQRRQQAPRIGESGAQLLVADLDRQHRVLQLGKPLLGLLDGVSPAASISAIAPCGRDPPGSA